MHPDIERLVKIRKQQPTIFVWSNNSLSISISLSIITQQMQLRWGGCANFNWNRGGREINHSSVVQPFATFCFEISFMRGSMLTFSGEPVQFGSIKLRKNCAIFSCLRLQRTSIVKVRIKNPGKSWLTIHCLITVITNLVVVWLNVLSLWIVGMIGQWYHNHHCWRQSWNQWNVWENSEHNETEM